MTANDVIAMCEEIDLCRPHGMLRITRDDMVRQRCMNPAEYDKVIDWQKENNPHCKSLPTEREREVWSVEVVNKCISQVLFGDVGHAYSTGSIIAIRATCGVPGALRHCVILAIRL